MSNFTNRLNGLGEFSVGQGKFVVTDVRGGLIRCVQTHSVANGELLPAFATENQYGVAATPTTQYPQGFVVPQNHPALDAVKAEISDLESRVLTLCDGCVTGGVLLSDMVGACDSCQANSATISGLKALV